MKRVLLLLAVVIGLASCAATKPAEEDERCAAEGGCLTLTMKALKAAMQKAYEIGRNDERAYRSGI